MLKIIAAAILIGYLSFGRSFAYWGVGSIKFFVGEAVLLFFVASHPKAWLDRWVNGLRRPGSLHLFCWSFVIFFSYGVLLLLRGLVAGRPPLSTLENAAFNVYPLYLFFGLWLAGHGFDVPGTLRRAAWFQGIYGLLYLAILSKLPLLMPGTTNVPVFGAPIGSGLVLASLICFPGGTLTWIPMCLNAFVLLSMQVRAEWVGFLAAVAVVSVLKRFRLGLVGLALIVVLLGVGYAADLKMDGPRGEISTRNIVGRFVSVYDPESAETGSAASVYSGTVTWRQRWWTEIWNAVHSDDQTMLFGFGYGYPLSYLAPFIKDPAIRTPHSIFYYCLGYGGWFGVFAFGCVQASLLWMHISTFRRDGNPFGIVVMVLYLVQACFSNLLETPFGAIPFYLLNGLALGPLVSEARLRRAVRRVYQPAAYPTPAPVGIPWSTQEEL